MIIETVSQKKDRIQKEARDAFRAANYWGIAAIATGVGKSRIAILECRAIIDENPKALIVIAVPTEPMKQNWKDEFEEWGESELYKKHVHLICYKSLHKIVNSKISLLVLDEGHNLTELSARIMDLPNGNTVRRCLVLTATPPSKTGRDTDNRRFSLFQKYRLKVFFAYTLDQAVEDGLVSPYQIRVVQCYLDNKTAYIKSGNAKKSFFQTELAKYNYLTTQINNTGVEWAIRQRLRLMQTLKSKEEIARRVFKRWVQPGERYIFFCGSIPQANSLCGDDVHHTKAKIKGKLKAFKNMEIDVLGAVNGINEGENIKDLDGALIVQIYSDDTVLTQQLGRTIRFREEHIAIIWVFVVPDSCDWEWWKMASEKLDQSKITYINYKNVI